MRSRVWVSYVPLRAWPLRLSNSELGRGQRTDQGEGSKKGEEGLAYPIAKLAF